MNLAKQSETINMILTAAPFSGVVNSLNKSTMGVSNGEVTLMLSIKGKSPDVIVGDSVLLTMGPEEIVLEVTEKAVIEPVKQKRPGCMKGVPLSEQ